MVRTVTHRVRFLTAMFCVQFVAEEQLSAARDSLRLRPQVASPSGAPHHDRIRVWARRKIASSCQCHRVIRFHQRNLFHMSSLSRLQLDSESAMAEGLMRGGRAATTGRGAGGAAEPPSQIASPSPSDCRVIRVEAPPSRRYARARAFRSSS
eukprot:3939162-Rhodomonas_salina.2